jgi:HD-GYP domain-containing protein (c-di-GMP phosphodiesterase class II)
LWAAEIFDELEAVTTWDAVIAGEPGLAAWLSESEFDGALEAIAEFFDVKSPYTIGHSRGVAELAAASARGYGLPPHDIALVRPDERFDSGHAGWSGYRTIMLSLSR